LSSIAALEEVHNYKNEGKLRFSAVLTQDDTKLELMHV
jgi:hypothetical protein